MKSEPDPTWQSNLYRLLKNASISIVTYVPDGGHKQLIEWSRADPDVTAVALTSEQEGVALAAGAHLGGARSVLLMQSSGVGNCINMLSLIETARFPFLGIVTMRGDYGEGNPWQMPMGRAVQPTLEAMGVRCIRAETPDDLEAAATAAITMAFGAESSVALLLSQRLIGAKAF